MNDTDTDDVERCTNVNCDREATHQVVLEGVSTKPYPYCTEHYRSLKAIEAQEGETA
jgi:hypothetical protein